MLLYPHLSPTIARRLAEELSARSIDSLHALSAISHPAAAYAPTGGNRVSAPYLREIDRCIRESADSCGYPSSIDDLRLRRFDASSGRILHEMMDISPSGASNPGVWAFMACVLWPDIVRWRFPGNEEGTSRERFIGGRRNTFGRAWWRAYILKQPVCDHPYELLDLLGEDELVQITERPSLAGSPSLAKMVCRTFLDVTSGPSNTPRSRLLLRDAMKRLRRLLPMVSFDALDEQVLKSLIEEVFRASIKSLQN
jgi:Family of unknown function (DUF6339)